MQRPVSANKMDSSAKYPSVDFAAASSMDQKPTTATPLTPPTAGLYPPSQVSYPHAASAPPPTYHDLESGSQALFPGILSGEQLLRMGFIRRVYGILSAQFVLTTLIAIIMMSSPGIKAFIQASPGFVIAFAILPLPLLIPFYCYRQQHPLNLALLALWTTSLSIGIGAACTAVDSLIVLEALVLTAGIALSLTAYTFYAVRKGRDFDAMGPILFSVLTGLVLWGFFALFLPMGPIASQLYSLLAVVLFSCYIVYDTFLIIKRFSLDDYIWASVNLYLDLVNLFLRLLELLNRNRD